MTEHDPLELAVRALRHRERSRHDVEARLERSGVSPAERAETLETLERIGYVDDRRLAEARAAELARRGRGDTAIVADLEHQGVSAELAAAAVAGLAPEQERARELVHRLGAGPRAAAQLARRGFEASAIEAALGADIAPEAW